MRGESRGATSWVRRSARRSPPTSRSWSRCAWRPAWRSPDVVLMTLLEPDVARIAPQAPQPSTDRAPDELARGTPEPLRSELVALLGPGSVLSRPIDLVRYASDASPYRVF